MSVFRKLPFQAVLLSTVGLGALSSLPIAASAQSPLASTAQQGVQLQSAEAKISNAGDIIVVEISGSTYRSWSIGTVAGTVSFPAWKPILGPTKAGQRPTLIINVNNARGAYISHAETDATQLKVRVIGTMIANGAPEAYPSSMPSQSQFTATASKPSSDPADFDAAPSGAIPDAPMIYLKNDHRTMESLRGPTNGNAGNTTDLLAFHNSAVLAARSMHKQVASANAAFVLTSATKVKDAATRALALRGQALNLAALAGQSTANPSLPNGHLIKAFADQLQAKAQSQSAAAQQSANQLPQKIPDAKVVITPCLNDGQAMLSNADTVMTKIEGDYPESTDWDGAEDNALAGLFEREGQQLEKCVIDAEGKVPVFDESSAPIPTVADADYRQMETDIEAFALNIETNGEAFETNSDTDLTETQFSLSVSDTLAFEKQMLATLRSVDTTGSISDEQNGFDQVVTALDRTNVQLAAGDLRMGGVTNASTAGLASDTCSAADFDFNMLGAGLVLGTPWQDKMTGSPSTDVMIGLSGADCIKGLGGVDLIFGMAGNDIIYGGDNHDFLFGNKGDDTIEAGKGKAYTVNISGVSIKAWLGNLVSGGAGKDKIFGIAKDEEGSPGYVDFLFGDGLAKSANAGGDSIDGNGGINFIFGQAGEDNLASNGTGKIEINNEAIAMGSFFFGGGGDDKVKGSPNMDFFFGAPGNDSGNTGDGMDFVFGGSGNDKISGDKGFDILFGGVGEDRMEGGEGIGTGTVAIDAELIFGGPGKDTLLDKGGFGALGGLFFGGIDDDIIRLGSGFNLLFGGKGGDLVIGGREIDLAFGGPGNDTVDGDMGIDLLFGGSSADHVNGGGGIVDLAFGGAGQDLILGGSDLTKIVGTDGIDLLFGNSEDDYVDGQAGIDVVFGDGGNDVVRGGNDIDLVFGMTGNDCVYGDDGIDFVVGGAGTDKVFGGGGIDLVMGNAGIDDLFGNAGLNLIISDTDGENIDLGDGGLAIGGGGNDNIVGNGTSIALGGDGDDRIGLTGASGVAFGGNGSDQITVPTIAISAGGAAADLLSGGAIAVGGDGEDQIRSTRIAFGGVNDDWIETSSGLTIAFGGNGADKVAQVDGDDLVFGGNGNDSISVPQGRSVVFGQADDDVVYVGSGNGGGETRDFVFGGPGDDTVERNTLNKKDAIFSASAQTVSITAPTFLPLGVMSPVTFCKIPDSIKGFAASVRGGLGSSLSLSNEIRDYPDKNNSTKTPSK